MASARLVNVNQQIADLEKQTSPLTLKMNVLRSELADLESSVFIAANDIHKSDVEFCNGPDRPHFHMTDAFIKWLRGRKSVKPWCEWNGRILRTSDFINGTTPLLMPARIEDLPD